MLKDEMDKPGIENAQLPFGPRGMGHMTESFQLIHGLVAESGYLEVLFLGKPFCRSDEMSETGLSNVDYLKTLSDFLTWARLTP